MTKQETRVWRVALCLVTILSIFALASGVAAVQKARQLRASIEQAREGQRQLADEMNKTLEAASSKGEPRWDAK